MRMRILVVLLLLLGAGAACSPTEIRFSVFTSGDSVRAVAATGGKVWCATTGGVLVFDGDHCERRITTADGLPSVDVRDLVVLGPDIVAVTSEGLIRLSADPNVRPRLMGCVSGALSATADTAGAIWVGTNGGGLYRLPQREDGGLVSPSIHDLPPPAARLSAPPAPRQAPVRRIVQRGGRLWVGTTQGVAVSEGAPGQATVFRAAQPIGWVNAFFEHRGELYAGTTEGLCKLEADAWHPVTTTPPLGDVRAGASFRGELWVASGGGLFSSADGATFARQAELPWVQVLAVVPGGTEGAGGRLYAGTADRGLWRHAGAIWQSLRVDGPPGGVLTGVASDDRRLWVGAFSGEVALLDSGKWRRMPRPAPPGEGVAQMVTGGDETWCRTSDGALYQWTAAGAWKRLARPWASRICFADGRLCVGGLGVAWVREGASWRRMAPMGMGSAAVTDMLRVNGRWWIATQRGLFRETAPGKWARHTLGTGLRDPWVTSLVKWRGEVWVGTFAGGLSRFNGGQWVREKALGDTRINALAAGRSLWCATPHGVWEREGSTWRMFLPQGELPAPGANALAVLHGRVAIATDAGLAIER
jgi:ligand-binding sensor domain-containing protein